MRLKPLLEEQDNRSVDYYVDQIRKLERLLDSGSYVLKTPYLYRGKNKRVDVKKKTTVSDREREPVDTDKWLDNLIDVIYRDCYPNYPRRRESRFASTKLQNAKAYGSEVYVIIPDINATLLSCEEDPFVIFDEIRSVFKKVDEGFLLSYLDGEFPTTDEVVEILKLAKKFYIDPESIDVGEIKKLGCLSGILKNLRYHQNELNADPLAIGRLLYGFDTLNDYFESLSLGYPANKESGGEVMFQGEYLQVPLDVFNHYMESQ